MLFCMYIVDVKKFIECAAGPSLWVCSSWSKSGTWSRIEHKRYLYEYFVSITITAYGAPASAIYLDVNVRVFLQSSAMY